MSFKNAYKGITCGRRVIYTLDFDCALNVIFTIAMRNGKVVWKHGPYLVEFQCELGISGVA